MTDEWWGVIHPTPIILLVILLSAVEYPHCHPNQYSYLLSNHYKPLPRMLRVQVTKLMMSTVTKGTVPSKLLVIFARVPSSRNISGSKRGDSHATWVDKV